jgi:hypothetical protein
MTNPKVVPIGRAVPVEAVVNGLRAMLARAESGDIRDIALCATTLDGGVTTLITDTEDAHRQLAAVALLQHRLASDIVSADGD